jgi:hypothetical protein
MICIGACTAPTNTVGRIVLIWWQDFDLKPASKWSNRPTSGSGGACTSRQSKAEIIGKKTQQFVPLLLCCG